MVLVVCLVNRANAPRMLKVRIICLDRREYFEIERFGNLIAFNSSVESKKKGTNWTRRQESRYNSGYQAAIMEYGSVLVMNAKSLPAEFVDSLSNQLVPYIGAWSGMRIVVDVYMDNDNSNSVDIAGFANISQTVSSIGQSYLKYDKVLI